MKNEAKNRKNSRRSVSESSPTHHVGSNENSDGLVPYFRSHMYPNECTDHRVSDTLYFSNVGRKIQKGCCLGHSQKGCVAYSGIDLESGQLLYITEWSIKYTNLEQKCIPNCPNRNMEQKCSGHSIDDFINYIERQVMNLSQLRHKNLISYECVLIMKKKDGILVYLVQDFVLGTSVCVISACLGWCAEGASMVARGTLDALIYLHNKGVSHSLLYDTTVFMDNCGIIRITDFALVPYLQELIGGQKYSIGDLPALGAVIESLIPTPPSEMRDFIGKCKSERTLSASDLLDHPFLRPVFKLEKLEEEIRNIHVKSPIMMDRSTIPTECATLRSRIQSEFEVLQFIGQGAFGDVLKVRNILDNRQYAIKRIPLSSKNRHVFKKMTREVELLSRLNHENVVRYYNSWIESANIKDDSISKLEPGDWSVSHESRNPSKHVKIDNLDSEWLNLVQNSDDSSSDGIEFVNSNGEMNESDSDEDEEESSSEDDNSQNTKSNLVRYMYIQMELCEKSTLRTAIDNGLYADFERLWRFFREIVEGLSHIHQQGMIHRDLKPVNVFIDSRDQVKIGDFGLATTSFLALQSQEQHTSHHIDISNSHTGKVGTALYVAPELTDNASKSTYSQKVDLYSLGVMLFEMSYPPLNTGMERIQILSALRTPDIVIPNDMLIDKNYENNVKVIRLLLNHDPSKRPTAEELLSCEYVPPAKLEANELQEMLRHVLANPQSKAYKHVIARCLDQQCDAVMELTYHLGLVPISPVMEFIKVFIFNSI